MDELLGYKKDPEVERRERVMKLGAEMRYSDMSLFEIQEYFVERSEVVSHRVNVQKKMDESGLTRANEITARAGRLIENDFDFIIY